MSAETDIMTIHMKTVDNNFEYVGLLIGECELIDGNEDYDGIKLLFIENYIKKKKQWK